MAISFDGVTKIATLSSGTVTLDIKDLWSRWVDWSGVGTNSMWPPAMSQVGGNTIDAASGTSIPPYIYLINGWRIKPQEANHTLSVTNGVLLVDGGGDPFVNTDGSFIIRINYSQPVQAITVTTNIGGGVGTVSEVRDAVWGADMSSYTTPNTFGYYIKAKVLSIAKYIGLK